MYSEILKDWRSMTSQLHTLREDQVLSLLEIEKQGAQRVSFLERLHQRYNALRVKRERKEMIHDLLLP